MENELISNAPLDVSFWGLVLQADAVVKIVMLILLIASIWSWSIIIEKTKRFLSLKRKAQTFEDAFWSGESLEELYKEEEKNDTNFAQHLAKLADLYVNDAFSCSHRAYASISKITEFLPSFAGLQLETEISALKKVTTEIKKPITCIIGGSKM